MPPPEWKPASSAYQHKLHGLIVNGPIEQNIFGKGGVYECLHIQKKSLSLKEYKEKMGVFDRITDELTADQVEEMVTLPLSSSGRISSSHHHFMELISSAPSWIKLQGLGTSVPSTPSSAMPSTATSEESPLPTATWARGRHCFAGIRKT